MQTKILYWSRDERDFLYIHKERDYSRHKERDYSRFQSSVGSV